MIAECNTCPYDKKECFARCCGVNLEVCVKRYAEGNYPVARRLNDEVKSNRYDLFHITAERDTLKKNIELIKQILLDYKKHDKLVDIDYVLGKITATE